VPGLEPKTARCLVEVVAPDGLLRADQKATLVRRLTEDIASVCPDFAPMEAKLRIWIVVRDVPDGSWGVAGFIASASVIKSGLGG
jgi:phenylpyruvate tautomerase PptA (4-oxalocrotonate tautomerase family)